ncbi:alkaline phosphatase D family protein [Luteolibacter yonseiensis]|uniref:Alkaline phosphatase D family protein n=1 Tax=Luteolibacter yonseiensis TaxID=1144680 RepID=A0A934QXJ6_9BACT|nr:alkaline phosphatase D family protein [Luteolibacter yonseiensis]MBK1814563.1 alkaline phosphatase D family protein [Luteolibacter yonseiensis]
MSLHLTRRSCIVGSVSALLALGAERVFGASGTILTQPHFPDYPFKLGVASGDPDSSGFVLWTRLAPKPLEGGGMGPESVQVFWQVSEDEAMTKIVARGETIATAGLGHSVHVEVGGLRPDRWYWYQFKAGSEVSQKGRTRTLEHRNRPAAETTALKMAFASCQHFEAGYYTAYDHMLAESPDLVFHLGDYIYEGPSRTGQVRSHVGPETVTLEHYRNRHAQYKTDASLQAMHAAAPWVVTWDDHEFDNNYAGDIPEEKSPTERLEFLKRRAAAYQAYYEHMPLRTTSIPDGPGMRLYRSIRHGKLVDFHFLDTRQYRSDQPNGDGMKAPGSAALDPKASILGEAQRTWLLDELTNSRPQWNVLAQQVMMARVDRERGPDEKCSMDQWPGYEIERRSILNAFDERKITNPVVLTGDIHTHWANDLVMDYDGKDSRAIGSEFVCSSITSKGDGKDVSREEGEIQAENPFVRYYSDHRGYVSCRIDAKQWQSDFRTVEYVSRPGAPVLTPASFIVENNRPGLQKA